MTPVFITGLDASALQKLGQQLAPLGLPKAVPLDRDSDITLGTWHQRVHAAGQNPPARMWEQLAAEIFVANMALPQWQWADPLALPLLDYWAEFDPAIRFILLVEPPLQTTLRHPKSGPDQTLDATDSALQHWQKNHHALLRFALRHPQRSMLLWGHQAQEPTELTHALHTRWGLQIAPQPNPGPTNATPPTECILAQHLGQVLCRNHPTAQQLLTDLHANVYPLATHPAPGQVEDQNPHPLELLTRYQQLCELGHQAAQIPTLQLNLKNQIQKTTAADKTCKDQQVQLGQLQSELKQTQEQAQAANAQHQSAQQKLQAELKQAQDQAQAANAQHLSAQQKLQADLKQAQDQAQAASAQHLSAQQKLQAELKQAQDQAQKQSEATQTALTQKEQLQKQHQETQEEAELLLNQLHVVQEELENYYYRNKELQAQATALNQLQQRWQQLFTLNRDLYAVENLRIETHQTGEFVCQLSQLDMAGRHFDQLNLTLQLQPDGSAVMVLDRPAEGPGPLLRWPTDIAPGTALVLQPQLHPDTPPQRAAAFIQLSSSDWQLVQQLHRLLLAALAQGLPNLPASEQQSLHTALQQSQQHLHSLRNMLRFDAALCPQAPTDQQLHLQLQGLSLQALHAPQLDLQLQQHTPQHTSLLIGASPLTASGHLPPSVIQVHLTPNGWYTDEPAPPQLSSLMAQLMGVFPLALVDAVHHGTEKASLKPWANTCRTLRQWPHTPCDRPPMPAVAPTTPAKVKRTETTKTTNKAKVQPKAKPQVSNKTAAQTKPSAVSTGPRPTKPKGKGKTAAHTGPTPPAGGKATPKVQAPATVQKTLKTPTETVPKRTTAAHQIGVLSGTRSTRRKTAA